MSRCFFAGGLNRLSAKSHITSSQSRAERSRRKSERFEQHRLAIRQRRVAQHERYLNAFKRAGSAFRLWWLILLGVMCRVVKPFVGQSSGKARCRTFRAQQSRGNIAARSDQLETRQLLTIDLVSTVAPGLVAATGNGDSSTPVLSADGTKVAFSSSASNLVSGDTNFRSDVFVKDLTTGVITCVSTDSTGTQGNNDSYAPVLSADGTKVAFYSIASNLVSGDTNGTSDVFVKDLTTGVTIRVSTDSSGTQGNSHSYQTVLSTDGTKVAFYSSASNLVSGDTNFRSDVFVKDLTTGVTFRVSTDSSGTQGNSDSDSPVLSADGTKIAFSSGASNLVSGDTNGTSDVFVKDLTTGVTIRVSTDSSGTQGNSHSYQTVLSADGTKIAFYSYASNLVSGDTNFRSDVFVKDLTTGVITCVSTDSSGTQGNNDSYAPVLSADGTKVAFQSYASSLVSGDTNGTSDVFVRDLTTGVTTCVSTDPAGTQGNSDSYAPVLSADGTKLAFYSGASNLVSGDTNSRSDVFFKDLTTGSIVAGSQASIPDPGGNRDSIHPDLSADGTKIAFTSDANNLVTGDSNNSSDVFLKDLTTNVITRISTSSAGLEGNGNSYFSALSADGTKVAFTSDANNLVTGDSNNSSDVFLKDLTTGAITRISTSTAGLGGNANSYSSALSADGTKIAFTSAANNLVPGDSNNSPDVFLKDLTTGVITRVSTDSTGTQGNSDSFQPTMSDDGFTIGFASYASNLVVADTNHFLDVFVKNMATGEVIRVSTDSAGTQGNNGSSEPVISANGTTVAFSSYASNLVSGDTDNGGNVFASQDVFVKDLASGQMTRVSVNSVGIQGNNASRNPVLSADGTIVAFTSYASNLSPLADNNGSDDIFVKHLATGELLLASSNATGESIYGSCSLPSLSADGTKVAFQSGVGIHPYDLDNYDIYFVNTLEISPTGSIEGTIWYDADHDGVQDPSESTLSDITMYIDENGNGYREGGEPQVLSNLFGQYIFENLPEGQYIIRQDGGLSGNKPWSISQPASGFNSAFVPEGGSVSGVDFGTFVDELAWIDDGVLYVCGLDSDDSISIHRDEGGQITVATNEQLLLLVDYVERIEVDGRGGDDSVTVAIKGNFPELFVSNDAITVNGGWGNDLISFTGDIFSFEDLVPSVWLNGGLGDDVLVGGKGSERLTGGKGSDTLVGRSGSDVYHFMGDGSLGEIDTIVEFYDVVQNVLDFGSWGGGGNVPVFVDLASGGALALQGDRRIVANNGGERWISTVLGSAEDDIILGNANNDWLIGGSGNDRIEGRGGDDLLRGDEGDDTFVFGSDTRLGSDSIGGPMVNEGIDTLDFSQTTSQSVTLDLAKPNAQIVNSNLTLTLGTGGYIENVIGGSQADTLKGSGRVNRIEGGGGNDSIEGRGGNDTLVGGTGDDTYLFDTDVALGTDTIDESGGGIDTLDFSGTSTFSITASLKLAALQTVNTNLKLILGSDRTIEDVSGGVLADSLTGNILFNRLRGNAGDDVLTGDVGNDIYLFDTDVPNGSDTINEAAGGSDTLDFSETTTRSVVVNLATPTAQVVNPGLTLTLGSATTMENVIGGGLGDTLTGNALGNRLTGNGSNDSLNGGAGNDTYVFDADESLGTDSIVDSAGIDTLDFSATTLQALVLDMSLTSTQVVATGKLSLTLTSAALLENVTGGLLGDTLTGNALNNVIRAGDGNDILTGGGGNDNLVGGVGNDQYRFDTDLALGNDTIDESGGGEDILNFGATTTRAVVLNLGLATPQVVNAGLTLSLLSGDSIESVVGGSLGDTLTGNSLSNRLIGNAGNDTMSGGVGDDTYIFDTDTALGSDTIIDDGGGRDTLDFSATTTRQVAINLGITSAQVVNAGSTLTLSANNTIENVLGGSLNDTMTGNALDNVLVGGAGNDTLVGGNGRDLLIGGTGVDTINGGAGEDILLGGTTSFDANVKSLNLITAEWSRTDQNYTQRINHLKTSSGGKNGSILLKSGTVQNDSGAADQLTGGTDLDWFFSSLNDGFLDQLVGSEILSAI